MQCSHRTQSEEKLASAVEGDPKVTFSNATTPRCREVCYLFPELLHFTLDTYLIMLSVKQGDIKYHFLRLWYDSPGIEPRSPRPYVLMHLLTRFYQLQLVSTTVYNVNASWYTRCELLSAKIVNLWLNLAFQIESGTTKAFHRIWELEVNEQYQERIY